MSQTDVVEKEIDGFVYKVMMLDPLVATDLLTDIGDILAPALGALGGAAVKSKGGDAIKNLLDGDDEGTNSGMDVAFEKAVLGFFKQYSKAKQREFISLLSKVTVVETEPGKEPQLQHIFSQHFRGRIKSLYKWLAFALSVQFQDFFSGEGFDISHAVQKLAEVVSASQST